MFDQPPDRPVPDQAPAPVGMRELPPQPPAMPMMPAFPPAPAPAPRDDEAGPGPDDSVVARDDRFEGTFTSRGTVRVVGSVKGRIEAVRVRIEDGARVEADVVVDEAIVAGEFTGNLTCRKRLEARPSGRISGHVETYKLMLHEGASVEGEVHMLTDAAKAAPETIRGAAPLRGGGSEAATAERPRETAAPRSPAAMAPDAEIKPAPRAEAGSRPATPMSAATGTVRVTPRTAAPVAAGTARNGPDSRI